MAIMDYRTQDGLADYGFSIEFEPNVGWRIYIVFEPCGDVPRGSGQLPYQARDGKGRRYVDWSGRLDNLGDARTVAALWAELIRSYPRTARAAPAGGAVGASDAGRQDRDPSTPRAA